jgi:pimeloyl-ACP methyl ester carboxylesterase
VYHPDEPPESKFYIEKPSLFNLPYENVDLITSDKIRIHSYFLKQPQNLCDSAPTIICFHGNAGNIGQRLSNAHCFYTYCQCNVFLVEYRGYGLSEGQASEQGFYKDGEAAINHVFNRSDIDKNKIIIFGQSIGGAVVIELVN